ncbi:MarR family winged helix-turn-helix transcriptional regulator [Streptoalloteichus tenebrarius]|uniref:MarR family winged helix-turn-helix transcriptional regulator n=1 Tax=Streptoalloteichus tenebrarius (strain ATCC 17920 / DSM 40477 / JCM 4838 / CBS 697.72 / NBRC 16177 / NCIMB 11028 / NRRL B-12390 / A12253. 1 / ISP 5477) TaxID=1933 RepID=UPI0020A2ADC8|nr:MarR family transcriptional regulator [Streptoalloteichus tenebrarius]
MTEEDALQLVLAVHRLNRTLRVSTTDLPPTQLIVLSLLMEHGPTRIGELAARVPCSQPTATTVVAGLEGTGLVRRQPDPADGRAVLITLTDEGQERVVWVARREAELLDLRMAELTPEERGVVLAATPLLRRLAGG